MGSELFVNMYPGAHHLLLSLGTPGIRVCFPLKWKCAHDSRLEARNSRRRLRLKVGEQNSSGLYVHFLPPHFV